MSNVLANVVRAKFRASSVTFFGDPSNENAGRQFVFNAVYDTSTPENERFSKATPYAELKVNVDNPAVQFEIGEHYYVDFTPAS